MSDEDTDHERGIDSISRFWRYGVNSGSVCDLRRLQAKIDEEGLDDGSSDGKGAGICADSDAGKAHELAEDDGEERDEFIDDEARVDGAEAHT